jgi:hypothetical protein
MIGFFFRALTGGSGLRKSLRKHFHGLDLSQIVTAAREFPLTSRVDVQSALENFFSARSGSRLLGIHIEVHQETPTLAHLLSGGGPFPINLGPLQYDDVDIGDPTPARCLKNALWLSSEGDLPFALLLGPSMRFGQIGGMHVEIGVPAGGPGAEFSQALFRDLEIRVAAGRAYRGRVISLESYYDYSGRGGSVKVHRLHKVDREDVILPEKTLTLLDRNVGKFIAARDNLKGLHCFVLEVKDG